MVDPVFSALLGSAEEALPGADKELLGNLIPLVFDAFGPG